MTEKIYSMTGFGKASLTEGALTLSCEVKTLNSKYLDLQFKLPKSYQQFEIGLKELVQKYLKRGRVDIVIQRNFVSTPAVVQEQINVQLETYRSIAERFECWNNEFKQRAILHLLSRNEIQQEPQELTNPEEEFKLALKTLDSSCQQVLVMREKEGCKLAQQIVGLIQELAKLNSSIKQETHEIHSVIKQKLESRLQNYCSTGQLDPVRLNMEAAFIADRADITEELTRLDSHFSQWATAILQYPQGRKLEFLIQEFGREYNTIASKAQNADIQGMVVSAKVCLEKIKEQVANIE